MKENKNAVFDINGNSNEVYRDLDKEMYDYRNELKKLISDDKTNNDNSLNIIQNSFNELKNEFNDRFEKLEIINQQNRDLINQIFELQKLKQSNTNSKIDSKRNNKNNSINKSIKNQDNNSINRSEKNLSNKNEDNNNNYQNDNNQNIINNLDNNINNNNENQENKNIKSNEENINEKESKGGKKICCVEFPNNTQIFINYESNWTVKDLIKAIIKHKIFIDFYPNKNYIFNSSRNLILFDLHLCIYRQIKTDYENKISFDIKIDDLYSKGLIHDFPYPFFLFKDNRTPLTFPYSPNKIKNDLIKNII